MRKKLMEILCCPLCKGDLELEIDEETEEEIITGKLICEKCDIIYPIEEGIPNMLPPELR
jgi:uncharacterized protein YbaR (Trm112 family)